MFRFTTEPPEFVNSLPRDSENGTVTEEVGVIQETDDGKRYWKAFQLIEKDNGHEEIRTGYYTESGGWQNKPLSLPPDVLADLVEFARGKVLPV